MACKLFKRRAQRLLLGSNSGQATVEYALLVFALLSVIGACAILWRTLEAGVFVEHAVAGASHHLAGVSPAAIVDMLLY